MVSRTLTVIRSYLEINYTCYTTGFDLICICTILIYLFIKICEINKETQGSQVITGLIGQRPCSFKDICFLFKMKVADPCCIMLLMIGHDRSDRTRQTNPANSFLFVRPYRNCRCYFGCISVATMHPCVVLDYRGGEGWYVWAGGEEGEC